MTVTFPALHKAHLSLAERTAHERFAIPRQIPWTSKVGKEGVDIALISLGANFVVNTAGLFVNPDLYPFIESGNNITHGAMLMGVLQAALVYPPTSNSIAMALGKKQIDFKNKPIASMRYLADRIFIANAAEMSFSSMKDSINEQLESLGKGDEFENPAQAFEAMTVTMPLLIHLGFTRGEMPDIQGEISPAVLRTKLQEEKDKAQEGYLSWVKNLNESLLVADDHGYGDFFTKLVNDFRNRQPNGKFAYVPKPKRKVKAEGQTPQG